MKIGTDQDGIVLREVFSGVKLVTDEGNSIGICMRDDTFEINVIGKDGSSNWHRVDPRKNSIYREDIALDDNFCIGDVVLYREHRGSLEESLKTIQHVRSFQELCAIIQKKFKNITRQFTVKPLRTVDLHWDTRTGCRSAWICAEDNETVFGYVHMYTKDDPRPAEILKQYGRELKTEEHTGSSDIVEHVSIVEASNSIALQCLRPRKLLLVQEHALAQPFYTFMLSDNERAVLQNHCGYFLVEKEEHETRDEMFAYTVDHGVSIIQTNTMSEVVRECAAAEARRVKSFRAVHKGKQLTPAPLPSHPYGGEQDG